MPNPHDPWPAQPSHRRRRIVGVVLVAVLIALLVVCFVAAVKLGTSDPPHYR
jgi:ABC-type transporter Mla subunit MlaD